MLTRYISKTIDVLKNSHLGLFLLGPRQTGKSTVIESYFENIAPKNKLIFKLQESKTYENVAKNPSLIFNAATAILEKNASTLHLYIDEIQLLPELLGDCQSLCDQYKGKIHIYVTGSSARKLRRQGINLLPGRIIMKHLHPLMLSEFKKSTDSYIIPIHDFIPENTNDEYTLEDILIYGTLPGIVTSDKQLRGEILYSYVSTYLQEEIRMEALARKLGPFSRFLELAALESSSFPNLTKLSIETGIPVATIKNYYDILEDTLLIFKVPPFSKAGRKRILATPKYYFYDTGIRNAAAGLTLDENLLKTQGGVLFETFVVLELIRRIDYLYPHQWKYYYWRTTTDIEVDFIIDTGTEIIPIEIKYSTGTHARHIKNLRIFMDEYNIAKGFIIGNFPLPEKLADGITAIPWNWI